MTYYVFYNCGHCNDGDHNVGLEKFDSLDKAKEFIAGLRMDTSYMSADTAQIICGHEVLP